jgi:predicted ATP-grasp superfamily ATP-dependent carboligase
MKNKLGSYISKLMQTILNKEQEEFVIDLALSELRRLNVDIEEFVRKHTKDISDEIEKTEKQLLQEDKNVKDK